MTDETRADLRRATVRFAIESILRHEGMGWPWKLNASAPDGIEPEEVLGTPSPPPLTTAQQLALSVLLGEAPEMALAEYLLDQGHEYAVAVAEKSRREERRVCAEIIRDTLDNRGWPPTTALSGDLVRALSVGTPPATEAHHPSTPPATS